MRDVAKYLEAQPRGMSVAAVAAEEPSRPAILSPHGDRSFGELNARANQLARALRARGLREGDAVALLCTNRPEFVEVYAATHRAGLRLTCVNWHLTPEESGYIAADCDAKALIADSRLAGLALGTSQRAPGAVVRLAIGGDVDGFDSYEGVVAEEDGADLTDAVLGTTMLYTSGTTGRPKGVYRRQPATGTTRTIPVYGYRPGEDVHLCTGPLYHAAPLAFSLADGTRRRRCASSSSTGSATPTWSRPCSTGFSPCPPRSGPATTSPRCASWCTAPRPVPYR